MTGFELDAAYGAGFQASEDSRHAVECELVEDGGAFVAHQPTDAARPRPVAFVDGTLRTEARLTRTGPDGDVSMGLAGSWAAGAVLVDGDEPARFRPSDDGPMICRRCGAPGTGCTQNAVAYSTAGRKREASTGAATWRSPSCARSGRMRSSCV